MNRREKILVLIILGLAAIFAADRLVVAPLTSAFSAVSEDTERLEAQLAEAQAMIKSADKIERRWSAVRAAGLSTPVDAARIRVQVQVTQWSQDCRLQVNTLSTGRVVPGDPYDRISFTLTGVGRLASIHDFMLKLHTAAFPLRITDCTIARRGDDSQELTLSLSLSTIALTHDVQPSESLAEANR